MCKILSYNSKPFLQNLQKILGATFLIRRLCDFCVTNVYWYHYTAYQLALALGDSHLRLCQANLQEQLCTEQNYTVFQKNCSLFIFAITLLILGRFG